MRPLARDPNPRVAIAIGILALISATASVMPQLHPNTWIFRDGRFYVNVATTIVEDASLDQHAFAASWYTGTLGWNADLDPGWSNVALGAHGEHWPKHPWIHPLLASPVFFAFGLPGTLAWNLVMFALIASGLYRFARSYTEPAAAVGAVAIFVYGTALIASAYDFSVDVLMLALFAQGLSAILARRGVLAGVCIALCVVIKPTALILLPALVATILERGDRRPLGRSLGAGTLLLFVYAMINWWMYGRPWLSGYNRTLVTVRGAPTVADHLNAFSTPFDEGIARLWSGGYGLSHTFTAMFVAAPGLLALARRRPMHVASTVFCVAASIVVFAKYEYEGHRFHWPALALLVPSLAMTIELVATALRSIRGTLRAMVEGPRVAGRVATIAIIAASSMSLLSGPSLEERVSSAGGWSVSILENIRTIGIDGRVAALFVIALNLGALGVFVSRLGRVLERIVPAPIASFALIACALVSPVREACVMGGSAALALALFVYAVERAAARRVVAAAIAMLLTAMIVAFAWEPDSVSLVSQFFASLDSPNPVRVLLPWGVLSIAGLGFAFRRDVRTGLSLGAIAIFALLPGIGTHGANFVALSALPLAALSAVSAHSLSDLFVRAMRGFELRRTLLVMSAFVMALLVIGGARRVALSQAPFRIASFEGIRHAMVFHGQVPCDFLAWEHMSWECSHFDAGLYGMVGLAISDPIRVRGERRSMMVLPTGRFGQERRVVWQNVRAGERLAIEWAVPDGLHGDGVLRVRADEREIAVLEIPPGSDGVMHELVIDTPDIRGQEVRLELSFRPREGRRQAATMALDAVWR
jgi:hypothetical protein